MRDSLDSLESVSDSKSEKLKTAGRMVAYSTGYMLGGGGQQITSMYYLNFLIFGAGLSPMIAGIVSGISKLWDGIIDPFLGLLVDRTKTRWGSCRPWLLACAVPVLISYYMLWNGFGIQSGVLKVAYYLFACLFFSTASSLGTVPYEALLPRMVESYGQRTDYSVLRSLFAGMASAGSIWLFEALVPAKEAADYANLGPNFQRMGFVLGLVFAIAPVITFLGSKERAKVYTPIKWNARELFGQYASLMRCRLYRRTLFLNLLGVFVSYCSTAVMVIFVLLVYSNRQINLLGINMSLTFFAINWEGAWEVLSFLTSIVLMKKTKSKFSPLRLNFPLHVAGSLLLLFIGADTPLWVFFLALAVSGYGASCIQFIPTTLLPDLPDVDELVTGMQREGTSAGLVNMSKQIMQGLAFLLCGAVLSGFGLSEETATPELAAGAPLMAVKLIYGLIPAICGVFMWLSSRNYPLTPERHALVQAKIREKREHGSAEVSLDEQAVFSELTGLPYEKLWIAKPLTADEISAEVVI
ncbi:MAG: MFS transporter [Oscillospiraceae bacterium]|jgi:Na+/melibiose symporter-like transporter|nr:MFS transporter [Oscillospiraceae bacterium]